MTSKTISLKEEAYRRLKKEKDGGESFSDIVLELTEKSKKDFSNIIGKKINIVWEDVKKSRDRKKEDRKRERLFLGH